VLLTLALASTAHAGDWPLWGRDATRNMVSDEKAPTAFDPGRFVAGTDDVDPSTTKGVRWVAKLGSQSYGNVTVSGGRVFVGTNNQMERRPGIHGDHSTVVAFGEQKGDFLWQLTIPKLGSGKVNDWEFLGVCSSPQVVGDTVYVVTNRGEVAALDVDGLKDGNDGPFQDEAEHMVAPGIPAPTLDPSVDADILWLFDVPNELAVFPHNISSNSVLVVGDKLFLATSNGADWSHLDIPYPFSPAFVALDRNTGALIGEEASGISEATLHSNWSPPTLIPAGEGRPAQVVFGGGDGFLHGFDVDPVDENGLKVLHERWRVDGNEPDYRMKDGEPVKYASPEGPSEFIATPVYADGLLFAAIGQDPEHGPGKGRLTAVKPDGTVAWTFTGMGRSISTVAVHQGIVYASDYDGRLHALDAKTGRELWTYETGAHVWGSPYVAGKVLYLGDEDGVLHELAVGRKKKVLGTVSFPAPLYATPVMANGTLYVATQTHLYAIDGRK
jgi:outer membrane protein assembly factor BamB